MRDKHKPTTPDTTHFWALRGLYLAWLNVAPLRPLLDRSMQRKFDPLAAGWEARIYSPDRLDPLWQALRHVPEHVGRIVDLGCGTGGATIELAQRYAGAWIVGVDISDPMLAGATAAAREAGVAIQFQRDPIYRTAVETGTVDLAVMINVPPPFAEVARILAPAGHAVVVYSSGRSTPFYSRPTRLTRGFDRAGMAQVACGAAGSGEYFVAAHAAVPVVSPRSAAAAKSSRVAEARR